MRFVLPLLALGFRLRTHKSVAPVEVLKVDAQVDFVDYAVMAQHDDLVEFTKEQLKLFFDAAACGKEYVHENVSALIQMKREDNATNATDEANATEEEPEEEAAEEETSECVGSSVILLSGNPFHVHAEMLYSEEAKENFGKDFPQKLSDFLLTIPAVLLYSSAPPICHFVDAVGENVTSVIGDCEGHLPPLIQSFHRAYTNRMVPFALDGACGSFSTSLSFSTQETPDKNDVVFCETATKRLMATHYEDVDFFARSSTHEDKCYQDWCVEVCEYRHGPTQICARPPVPVEEAPADNATAAEAPADNATDANATANASLVHAHVVRSSANAQKSVMDKMKKLRLSKKH